jgi:hypothetical protein
MKALRIIWRILKILLLVGEYSEVAEPPNLLR